MKIALLGRMAFAAALSLLLAPLSASASDIRETLTFHVSTFGPDHPSLITWYDGPTAYSVWSTLSFDGISQIDTLTNAEAGYMVMYWTADHGSWDAYWQGAEDAPDAPPLSPRQGESPTYLRDFVQPYTSSQKHAYAALDWLHEYIPANRASLAAKHGDRQVALAAAKAREEAIKQMEPQELVLKPIEEQLAVLAEKVVEAVDAGDMERAVRLERARKSLVEPIGGNEQPKLSVEEWWEQQNQALTKRALDYKLVEQARLNSLRAEAARLNYNLRWEIERHRPYIAGLSGEVPIYFSSFNDTAADTISVDELWPGGSTGKNLTGQGFEIGLWEVANLGLLTIHHDFQGRVTQGDTPFFVANHPTQVAGTMAAGGSIPGSANVRGMAYQANVTAYEVFQIQSELGAEASTGLRISNHSYGAIGGWHLEAHPDGTPGKTAWFWRDEFDVVGGLPVLPLQGYRHGNYLSDDSVGTGTRQLDGFSYSSLRHLLVWAAGNERDDIGPGQTGEAFVDIQGEVDPVAIPAGNRPDADGDEGGYDTLSPTASQKNALTIGAVKDIVNGYSSPVDVMAAAFSGFGPTDDGRIKPDIVANGVEVTTTSAITLQGTIDTQLTAEVSGTSFSAPSVTGALGLVLQRREQLLFGAEPLLASTLKGLAVHTADEAGAHVGPDYQYGWGLLNAPQMIEVLEDDSASETCPHIKEVLLKEDDFVEFAVVSDGAEPLKATICWTDPQGNPDPNQVAIDPQRKMLINDLDLRVLKLGTDGAILEQHEPWILDPDLDLERASVRSAAATTGDDEINNVEQVYLASPSAGTYTIRITHKNDLLDGEQWLSIIVSGNTPQPKPILFPADIDVRTVPDAAVLLFEGTIVGNTYRLEESQTLLDGSWTTTIADISATKESLSQTVPFDPAKPDLFFRLVSED